MSKKLKYQTLHCHTTTSDGLMTYSEVLDVAEKCQLKVVAFTDHDALPDETSLEIIRKSRSSVDWVFGIEISAGLPEDLTGSRGSAHVVGLFVDPTDKSLLEHCDKAREARVERMKKTVKHLTEIGFDISEKDVHKFAKGVVGRPHIVEALKSKKSNLKVIEKYRLLMKKEAEKDSEIKIRYDEMMRQGERQYPYVLFLGNNSFVKGVYVGYTYRVDWDKAVADIRNAGGVALLAHWFTDMKRLTRQMLDKLFAANRLDGAETVYGLWTGGKLDRLELEKQRKTLKKLIEKHEKLESGGVDAHSREDFELFAKQEWYAKRTIGLIEKIMQSGKVNSHWSSL